MKPADKGPVTGRTAETLGLYAAFGCLGYLLTALGAILPQLREERGLPRAETALYPSAFALGLVIVGLVGHRLAARLGRYAIPAALTALVGGAALLAAAGGRLGTAAGALVLGLGGAGLVQLVPAALRAAHQGDGTIQIGEANAVSSAASVLSPIFIGVALAHGLGWRPAFAAPPLLAAATLLLLLLLTRPLGPTLTSTQTPTTSTDTAPTTPAPAPGDASSTDTDPGDAPAGGAAAGGALFTETAPRGAAPGGATFADTDTDPAGATAAGADPTDAVPAETAPGGATSADIDPGDAPAGGAAPGGAAFADIDPVEGTAAGANPSDAVPAETAPGAAPAGGASPGGADSVLVGPAGNGPVSAEPVRADRGSSGAGGAGRESSGDESAGGGSVGARPSCLGPARRSVGVEVDGGVGFWGRWVDLVLAVGVEFCMVFWAADFLGSVKGLGAGGAATLSAGFVLGMAVGRAAAGPVVRRGGRPDRLLAFAAAVGIGGFAVLWASPAPVAVAGLVATGLGVALLYPVILGQALAARPSEPVRAAARCALASGVAIGVAPLVLGALADLTTLRAAVLVAPVLLLVLLVRCGRRLRTGSGS